MFEKESPNSTIMDFHVRTEVCTHGANPWDVSEAIQDTLADSLFRGQRFNGGVVIQTEAGCLRMADRVNPQGIVQLILEHPDLTDTQRRDQLKAIGDDVFAALLPQTQQELRAELSTVLATKVAEYYTEHDSVEWGKATILP